MNVLSHLHRWCRLVFRTHCNRENEKTINLCINLCCTITVIESPVSLLKYWYAPLQIFWSNTFAASVAFWSAISIVVLNLVLISMLWNLFKYNDDKKYLKITMWRRRNFRKISHIDPGETKSLLGAKTMVIYLLETCKKSTQKTIMFRYPSHQTLHFSLLPHMRT